MWSAHSPIRAAFCALLAVGLIVTLALEDGQAARHWVVVIDAGHGGRDPGAIGHNGAVEKEITLAIARLVEILALDDPQLQIILTRRSDATLSLKERIAIARRVGADLYVSIHANAYTSPQAQGVETLIPASKASPKTRKLAQRLQASLVAQVGSLGVPNRGVKSQRLYLRWAEIPTALVEVGFLTNPEEGRRLQELWYQARIAQAILQGIRDFLRNER